MSTKTANFKKPDYTKTRKLVIFAILTAIIVLMAFTPVGYLRVGVLEITFLMIPVIIGAATLGPLGGLGLGFVFGLTSFLQCFGISAGGTMMFNLAPVLTALTCFLPRLLFGLIAGFLYKFFKKYIKVPVIPEALTMILSAILHTVMFVVLFYVCFKNEEFLQQYGDTFFKIVWAMVGINAIVEWAVCGVFGTAILKTLDYFIARYDKKKAKAQEDAELVEIVESQDTAEDEEQTFIVNSSPDSADNDSPASPETDSPDSNPEE